MRVVTFFLFSAAASVAEIISVQQEIEIIDFLSKEYFGSRVVIFLQLQSEGAELIKAASSVGLISTVLSLSAFQKIANLDLYPVPILAVSLDENHVPVFSQLTNEIKMSNIYWVVFSKIQLEKAENFHIPYNCKFLLITPKNGSVDLKELYKIGKGKPLQSNDLATWNSSKCGDLPKLGFYFRRLDLMGIELNYLTHTLEPCAGGDEAFAMGLVVPCIQHLVWQLTTEMLNITTKPVLFTEERNFSLVTEALAQPQTEMSIAEMFLSSGTVAKFDFFWPLFKTDLNVYVRYGQIGISWDRYLRPFTNSIWIAVIASTMSCSFVIFIAQKMASFYLKIQKGCHPQQFWTAIFAFLSQGTTEPAYSRWERLLLLSAFIGPAVLIPAYSASLTSFLAVRIPEMPFTELSEMKSLPQYKLTGAIVFDVLSYLQQGNDETSKYLINHALLKNGKRPKNDMEGVARMCKEPLAFVSTVFIMIALKPPCDYYVLPKKFVTFYQSMIMVKNSSYALPFNIIMRKMRFTGVLMQIKTIITKKQLFAMFLVDDKSRNLPAVDFESILVLLFFLAIAATTSSAILLMETIVFTTRRKKQQVPVSKPQVMYPFSL